MAGALTMPESYLATSSPRSCSVHTSTSRKSLGGLPQLRHFLALQSHMQCCFSFHRKLQKKGRIKVPSREIDSALSGLIADPTERDAKLPDESSRNRLKAEKLVPVHLQSTSCTTAQYPSSTRDCAGFGPSQCHPTLPSLALPHSELWQLKRKGGILRVLIGTLGCSIAAR